MPTSKQELPELGEPDENGVYTLENGRRIRVMANGTWRDAKTGHFVTGPAQEHLVIQTSEDGRELGARGITRARQKAREGALLAAIKADLDVREDIDAWGHIVAMRTAVALTDPKKDGTDAARFVGQATGFMNDEAAGPSAAGKVPIDVNTLMELARAIDSEVETRVSKARAIDARVIE